MRKPIGTVLPWILVGFLLAVIAGLLWRKPEPPKKEPPRRPDSGATEIVRTAPAKPPVSAGMALPHP